MILTLRKKCPYSELFWSAFSPHFSHRMRENAGKMRTRITPNKDSFYSVLHSKAHSGPRQTAMINPFAKLFIIVLAVNYFCKKLHFRYLTGSRIHLWIHLFKWNNMLKQWWLLDWVGWGGWVPMLFLILVLFNLLLLTFQLLLCFSTIFTFWYILVKNSSVAIFIGDIFCHQDKI